MNHIILTLCYLGQAEVAVNWCPALGTVLSNEEVIDGLSERGSHPVIRKVRFELAFRFVMSLFLLHNNILRSRVKIFSFSKWLYFLVCSLSRI